MSNQAKVLVLAAIVASFLLGRLTAPDSLLSRTGPAGSKIARYSGGALGADDVRDAIAGTSDARQRRAAVEQLVRARLLAERAEAAGRERTPDFLRRYSEELARLEIEKSFDEPFKKQLPTDAEIRSFFDEHQAQLGRPERVRLAHVALLAPASDPEARALKRKEAEKALGTVRRSKDDYAFGRLALTLSDDPRSRPAAGELPFLTREEIAQRLGPEVAEFVFGASPAGLVDHVVESAAGFQLVKVLAREEGREARYDELRDAIKARITADRREKAFKEFMDRLWASGDVKIDEAALERIGREQGAQAPEDRGPHKPVAVAK
ncbi:peptidylprolyl isomerase [Anaeromyxobacter oryzisoli]|uniref:peptidylprolyl isomerase n=1 Tax=Anaeromyxobacter oryzisoli TaxID=2925408 RepID=UPI001F5A7670|nr:peptidyl-prolyl cis-trans isomerase [Anaeromyxobacter sp. SG63]